MATPKTLSKAKELLDAGKLQTATEFLIQEVREHPADSWRRTLLFELLCFNGDWDRAEKQLELLSKEKVETEIGVQVYRNNIAAEKARAELYPNGLKPHFFTAPPTYVEYLLNAINRLRELDFTEVCSLLDQAEAARPKLKGKFNGKKFSDFRDYSDFLGSVLEVFLQDKYYWLPLAQLKQMELSAPQQLRDLLWARAHIETIEGLQAEVFLPTLYVGSNQYPDDDVKLGRKTEWSCIKNELYSPLGQHIFLVGKEGKALMELQKLEFHNTAGDK
jgi:type VI secretion system protein ImpE